MSAIWKTALKITGTQEINIPKNSSLLTVQVQNDTPTLWFVCNPEEALHPIKIYCHGTGYECPVEDKNYLGTIQFAHLVFHYFSDGVINE